MLETIKKNREYLDYIEEHYNNVQKAWMLINDKCKNSGFVFMCDDEVWWIINREVELHDLSKLSKEEFVSYRQYFFPTDQEKKELTGLDNRFKIDVENEFKLAWDHHKECNLHHWQTWTKKETRLDIVNLITNIVDWMAMGMKFGDTAKNYYEKNQHEIKLPDWAVKLMYEVFNIIYDDKEK